jgi:hypothetical protein
VWAAPARGAPASESAARTAAARAGGAWPGSASRRRRRGFVRGAGRDEQGGDDHQDEREVLGDGFQEKRFDGHALGGGFGLDARPDLWRRHDRRAPAAGARLARDHDVRNDHVIERRAGGEGMLPTQV